MKGLHGEAAFIEAARGRQGHLFDVPVPVLAAYGFGVDSTAMLVRMLEIGERVDFVLSADTRAERPESMDYLEYFRRDILKARYNVDSAVVTYEAKRFKNFPRYHGLLENCLTNATLPSIAFGFSSCSLKHKVQPQNAWTRSWQPAIDIWGQGGKVVKLIGYDAGKQDSRRYAVREDDDDKYYIYRTPLREWGADRAACVKIIEDAGLPVPPKSSCFFCLAMKPDEVRSLPPALLRIIVLLEARAGHRLRSVEGLWRTTTFGRRGSEAKPGSMTIFIRQCGLLPADEIEAIIRYAPQSLIAFLDDCIDKPLDERPELREWIDFFHAAGPLGLDMEGRPKLYAEYRKDDVPHAA